MCGYVASLSTPKDFENRGYISLKKPWLVCHLSLFVNLGLPLCSGRVIFCHLIKKSGINAVIFLFKFTNMVFFCN